MNQKLFKMRVIRILSVLLLFNITSCNKDCDTEQKPGCSDAVPTNEACLAYFERWFYNKNTNSCEKIGYSGCSQKGLATLQECEECKCN